MLKLNILVKDHLAVLREESLEDSYIATIWYGAFTIDNEYIRLWNDTGKMIITAFSRKHTNYELMT